LIKKQRKLTKLIYFYILKLENLLKVKSSASKKLEQFAIVDVIEIYSDILENTRSYIRDMHSKCMH